MLPFAQKVNDYLAKIGFEYCPALMMASNASYCLSLDEWKSLFYKWVTQPGEKEVMMCTIFLIIALYTETMHWLENLPNTFFHYLTDMNCFCTCSPRMRWKTPHPELLSKVCSRKNGEHKNEFDIKLRAMMPLVDAARLLVLSHRIGGENNTVKRYQKLANTEPENADLYQMAADAYEVLLRIRALSGLHHKDSGRYIQADGLDKMTKLQLRNAFVPIDEVQQLIKHRFQLGGRL